MRQPARYLVRFVVIVALLATLPLLAGPSNPKNSPYLSALADLPAGPALAATHCADRSCAGFGGPCMQEIGFRCIKGPGQCFTRGC